MAPWWWLKSPLERLHEQLKLESYFGVRHRTEPALWWLMMKYNVWVYLDISLASGERKTDEANAIYGNNLITDVELATACCGTTLRHVGYDDGRQHRTPARFHNDHAEYFAFCFWYNNLKEIRQKITIRLMITRSCWRVKCQRVWTPLRP